MKTNATRLTSTWLLFSLLLLHLIGCSPSPEPRYLFDVSRRLQQPKSPQQNQLDSIVFRIADRLIELPAPEREVTGRRLLGVSRLYLKRVSYLSYAYQLTGDDKYSAKTEEMLLKASSFEDWNPSHFLDVAEMTLALAIGLDWCRPALSDEAISATSKAIIEKGLEPSMEGTHGWLTARHNWNQVCNGGLAVGAMAVYDQVPELADSIIRRSRQQIKIPEEVFAPDGVYPEGSSYWDYGTSFHVVFLDAYRRFFPSEALEISEAFLNSGQYMLHVMGPAGFFNYSDNSGGNRLFMPLFWIAGQTGDHRILYHQRQLLDDLLAGDHQLPIEGSGNRLLPFLLLALNKTMLEAPLDMSNQPLSWSGGGENPVSFHRSGWGKTDTYVGIKAGSPGVNHGHMDVGSFVLDAKGQRWVIDLGMHNYHKLESQGVDLWNRAQNSQRWDILRYNNFSHSTLVIDQQLQTVDMKVELLEVSGTDSLKSTTLDLSPMYPTVSGVVRTVSLIDDGLVAITDEVKNNDQPSTIRWAIPTRAAIGIRGSTATLTIKGAQITVEIISPETEWTTYSAQPDNLFEDANPGVTMLGFETTLAPNALEELLVEFRVQDRESL